MTADKMARKNIRSPFRIILNIIIILASIGAWLGMVFYKGGLLTATGLRSLKYFTVLSNLFEGAACIIWIIASAGQKPDSEKLIRAEKLKYMATVSVTLTFMTVMFFLGPLFGYIMMLSGANFFLHLLVPVMALAECIFLSDTLYTRRDNLIAVLPMLAYGCVYLANNLKYGIDGPAEYDWYGFLNWGYPAGIAIFAALCAATWLAGAVLRWINNHYGRKVSVNGDGD